MQKPIETYRNMPKQTEKKKRNRLKQSAIDRNRQKHTDTARNLQKYT